MKGWLAAALGVALLVWGISSGEAVEEKEEIFQDTPQVSEQTTQEEAPALEFPYLVRGTGLIVEQFAKYEGPYPMDGSGEPLAHVAALMIYNPGKDMIADAQILVRQGQETLRFSFTYLPPASKILVLENGGKAYETKPVTGCSCTYITKGSWGDSKESLGVDEGKDGLQVENISGRPIFCATLYYKQYISQGDFYIGGETRECLLYDLAPGECREILPEMYAPGYTKVVAVAVRYQT